MQKRSSEIALASIRWVRHRVPSQGKRVRHVGASKSAGCWWIDLFWAALSLNHIISWSEQASKLGAATLPTSIVEAWTSLPSEVRSALVAMETSSSKGDMSNSMSSYTSTTSSESGSADKSSEGVVELVEKDEATGTTTMLKPLERAPENVFAFKKTLKKETTDVKKTPGSLVTTKTTVMTQTRGWRNIFTLPISYDVNVIPYGTILDPSNVNLNLM